jgi:hypothetical protein
MKDPGTLQEVLSRLGNELRPTPGQSALMIAPPLLRRRFMNHMLLGALSERLTGRPREFPRLLPFREPSLGKRWQEYERKIVMPSLRALLETRERTAVEILPHVTRAAFRRVLLSRRYKVAFLIAHHVVRGECEWIELADGGVPIAEIEDLLTSLSDPLALVTMVCTSAEIERAVYGRGEGRLAVGTYNWRLTMPAAVTVCAMYVNLFDSRRPLSAVHTEVAHQLGRRMEV